MNLQRTINDISGRYLITPPGRIWGSPGTDSTKAGLFNGGLPGTFSLGRPLGVPQAPLARGFELVLSAFL